MGKKSQNFMTIIGEYYVLVSLLVLVHKQPMPIYDFWGDLSIGCKPFNQQVFLHFLKLKTKAKVANMSTLWKIICNVKMRIG